MEKRNELVMASLIHFTLTKKTINRLNHCKLSCSLPVDSRGEIKAQQLWSIFLNFFFNFKIFNSYMRSQTWTPLPPPSHSISLGHPHAPAPRMLHPASDIDWRFNSYMIVYMLECRSFEGAVGCEHHSFGVRQSWICISAGNTTASLRSSIK